MAKPREPGRLGPKPKKSIPEVEAEILADAKMYLSNARERRERSHLYRWAQLVMKRHKGGRPIANARNWLEALLVGGVDPDYLE
jgi:hypothetical protein